MILHVKFITAIGKGDHALVESYLYGHKIVEYMESDGKFIALIRVEATTNDRATYLAKYQAARFHSGLIVAVVTDYPPGEAEMAEIFMAWQSRNG